MTLAIDRSDGGISPSPTGPLVNDVTITVATSNGTGSQSANLILMRAIFNMGIPVSGKNMFPSNIQGLPTWFTVRANGDGWTARRRDPDVFVAMNVESVAEDIAGLRPGAFLIINKSLESYLNRTDLNVYAVPFDELVVPVCKEMKLRKMVINILYVGVLAHLFDIDMEEVKKAIARQFQSKATATRLNTDAAVYGYEWATKNLPKQNHFTLRKDNKTQGKIIIEGNQAAGLGLVFGGLQVLAWYPITPSSSLCESAIDFLEDYRKDPDGKATYAHIQAEDELASMAMVVGAGWAGARAATATAGPGISLMSELAGLAYFAEIPSVILDVQRMGPSTGLPTRTNQGDISFANGLSHGDTKHPLLLPGSVEEVYEFGQLAFDLAERLQTPIFVMSDLDLGMNLWMADPFKYPERKFDRGKVLTAEELKKLNGDWGRYRDADDDGIPWRTVPGTEHEAAGYFTRGSGHDENARYSELPEVWKRMMDRLRKKYETAKEYVPKPIVQTGGSKIGILAYGSSHVAVEEAREKMAARGLKTDYIRIRAVPFNKDVLQFITTHDRVYVVDQNRDGQMYDLLRLELKPEQDNLVSVRHYDGTPIPATAIMGPILVGEGKATRQEFERPGGFVNALPVEGGNS